ncbi:MAG: amidohydrolase family protein [Anaerolineales bacterium]|nr:amidohydrolase family protein [Anaerolineales bacterium]
MKHKLFILVSVLLLAALACGFPGVAPAAPTASLLPSTQNLPSTSTTHLAGSADIVFINGQIVTMNPSQPAAQAIAVGDGKILAVGSNDEALLLRGDSTQIIDLGGLTIMPGFVDSHSHMFGERLLYDQDPLPDQQIAIELGLTTTAEFYVEQSILDELIALANSGKLRMRVNAYLLYTNNCGEPLGDWWKAYQPNRQIAPNLYVRGVKIFSDGGSCKIPAMSVEYPGGGKGDLFFTQEQMNHMVVDAQSAGFQVAIHALGDRALEQAQNAIAFALNGGSNIYRHRIEHNATIRPDLLPHYGEIGIIPVVFGAYSTCIRSTGESGKFKYILSDQYGAWDWPWRALADANPSLPIAWQADYPIFQTIDPLYHMWGFVTRKQVNTDGSICNPPDWLKAGALRIEEVLPIMTINSAHALFFENEIGSLEPGKLADLVILKENPLQIEADRLKDNQVLMTMIGGKAEYCAAGFESLCPSASVPDLGTDSSSTTASTSLPDSPPANAVDGNMETIWSSGAGSEQWIQIDLGETSAVSAVRLTVSQYPEGQTVHQIWAGADSNNLTLVHEFNGITRDSDALEFTFPTPLTDIRFIRILTTQSPSWVAWREIEIVSP